MRRRIEEQQLSLVPCAAAALEAIHRAFEQARVKAGRTDQHAIAVQRERKAEAIADDPYAPQALVRLYPSAPATLEAVDRPRTRSGVGCSGNADPKAVRFGGEREAEDVAGSRVRCGQLLTKRPRSVGERIGVDRSRARAGVRVERSADPQLISDQGDA